MIAERQPKPAIAIQEKQQLSPLVFPDSKKILVMEGRHRKALEQLINAKKASRIMPMKELCSAVYPELSFRDASNNLGRVIAILRHSMFRDMGTAWRISKVTLKPGGESTAYELKSWDEEHPKKPTAKPPTQAKLSTNGKTAENPGDVRSLTISDIARNHELKLSKVQRIAYTIRDTSNPNFGRPEEGLEGWTRYLYSEEEAKQIIERAKASKTSPANSPVAQDERLYTTEDVRKVLGVTLNTAQEKAKNLKLGEFGRGEYGRKRLLFTASEFKILTTPEKATKSSSFPRKKGEVGEKQMKRIDREQKEKAIRVEKWGDAVTFNKYLQQVSTDFTNAILNHLTMPSSYANPLDSLDRDLSLITFLIYSSNTSRGSIEELTEKYTTKQIETSILISFIKTLNELANGRDMTQKEPEIKTRLRISKTQIVINRYKGPIDEDEKNLPPQRQKEELKT